MLTQLTPSRTAAEYSWSIANNFVIGVYCRCLQILCQIEFSSIDNYFRSYRKKKFGIKSVGIYSRRMVEGNFNLGLFNPKLQPQTLQPQTFQP